MGCDSSEEAPVRRRLAAHTANAIARTVQPAVQACVLREFVQGGVGSPEGLREAACELLAASAEADDVPWAQQPTYVGNHVALQGEEAVKGGLRKRIFGAGRHFSHGVLKNGCYSNQVCTGRSADTHLYPLGSQSGSGAGHHARGEEDHGQPAGHLGSSAFSNGPSGAQTISSLQAITLTPPATASTVA
jgi:hypothetical protein